MLPALNGGRSRNIFYLILRITACTALRSTRQATIGELVKTHSLVADSQFSFPTTTVHTDGNYSELARNCATSFNRLVSNFSLFRTAAITTDFTVNQPTHYRKHNMHRVAIQIKRNQQLTTSLGHNLFHDKKKQSIGYYAFKQHCITRNLQNL